MEAGDVSEVSTTQSSSMNEFEKLSKALSSWKELLVSSQNILLWKEPHYAYCIAGTVSVTFLFWWWMNVSVVTTLATVLAGLTIADYTIPTLVPKLFSRNPWDGEKERQYESICRIILEYRNKLVSSVQSIREMKSSHPRLYIACAVLILFMVGLVGYLIDNTLLLYLFVLALAEFPGAYSKGYVACAYIKVWEQVKKLFPSKQKPKEQ